MFRVLCKKIFQRLTEAAEASFLRQSGGKPPQSRQATRENHPLRRGGSVKIRDGATLAKWEILMRNYGVSRRFQKAGFIGRNGNCCSLYTQSIKNF